jgi:hypothetical protein
MAYTLQGIVFKKDEEVTPELCEKLIVTELAQDFVYVSLEENLIRKTYKIPYLPMTFGGQEKLPEEIVLFISNTFPKGRSIYVEAEYFGGTGMQYAALFEGGVIQQSFTSGNAINKALHAIGVEEINEDEFSTIGLGKLR